MNLRFLCDGRIETARWRNSWTKRKNDRFPTRTIPEWWYCRQISRLELHSFVASSFRRFVVSSFRCFVILFFRRFVMSSFCHVVVSSFCDRDRRTSKFQFFEFQTRPVTIAAIAMTTRPIRLSARSKPDTRVKFLDEESRDKEKVFCVKSSTNKNAHFFSVVQKVRGHFFSKF